MLAVVGLGLGCGKKKDDTAGDAATAAKGVETLAIPARKPPKIEIEDAGAEPRAALRLHPAAGAKQELELTMGTRMTMTKSGEEPLEMPVPTIVVRLQSAVGEVDDEGFRVDQSVTAVTVVPAPDSPPAVAKNVEETVAPLRHYRSRIRMDERGTVLGGEAEMPRDLPANVHAMMQQMTQSLGQMSVPLPEDPVGPGAKWTTVEQTKQSGMKIRQTSHYQLVSRQDDRLTFEVRVEQELLDPNVQAPGMSESSARASEFRASGKGSSEIDLSAVAPISMTMNMDLSMVMDLTVLGQHQNAETQMGMSVTMRQVDG